MITLCCSLRRIYDTETFVIFFSKSSKQVHKVIISKDLIWSSYSIHFVSLHHYTKYHHHHHHLLIIMQQSIWKLQHPLPSPRATHRLLIIIQGKGEGGRRGEIEPCLTGIGEFEPEVSRLSTTMQLLYIIEYGGV